MSFANYDVEAQKGSTSSASEDDRQLAGEVSPIFNSISSQLTEFISSVKKLDKTQMLLGTKRDDASLRASLTQMTRRCNLLHDSINGSLQKLEGKSKEAKSGRLGFTEEKLRSQCHEVFKNYRVILRNCNEKIQSVTVNDVYRKNMEAQAQKNHSSESTPLLADSQAQQTEYTDQQLQEQLQIQRQEISESELAYHADLVNEREQAIANISKGVQDINKIFRDLNMVVNQQGEQIDTIEDSMNNYADNTQLAHHELRKADEWQKKKRKWSCALLLVMVIVFLIVLALIS